MQSTLLTPANNLTKYRAQTWVHLSFYLFQDLFNQINIINIISLINLFNGPVFPLLHLHGLKLDFSQTGVLIDQAAA